jgi:hypothetical protein
VGLKQAKLFRKKFEQKKKTLTKKANLFKKGLIQNQEKKKN